VAVINPADKLRFGEDSTPRIYVNVKKAAEEAGLEPQTKWLSAASTPDTSTAPWRPRRQTPRRDLAVGGFETPLLSYVANFKKPPTPKP